MGIGFRVIVLLGIIFYINSCLSVNYENAKELDREPVIDPDYSGVTIPSNIAPMNFAIKEGGTSFKVSATSSNGTQIWINSPDAIVKFPEKSWKKLLSGSQGEKILIEIYTEVTDREIVKYKPIHFNVAPEPIDPYLCYRLLYPGYETWSQIKIIQRNIENFSEVSLVENQLIDNNCVNCHSFNKSDPEKFLIHIRGSRGGTFFIEDDKIIKTDLKTENMTSSAVYPAWHPGGRYVAFSSNNVIQTFQAAHGENIEVFDLASSMVLYDTKENEMLVLKDSDTIQYMETFPEWSPDGKYLYYCRAEQFIEGSDSRDIKYDMVRKAFDEPSRYFGKTEMVYSASSIDRSVSFPRISPDGQYLVFTLHNYGTFSIWHREADLYMLDMNNGNITQMSLNSSESESYHSWSTNSRWLVFSSKRTDGLTAQPYFAYVGSADNIGKPFVLPQRDPTLYHKMFKTFNKPEFVSGKISLGPRDFAKAARGEAIKARGLANDSSSHRPGSGIY